MNVHVGFQLFHGHIYDIMIALICVEIQNAYRVVYIEITRLAKIYYRLWLMYALYYRININEHGRAYIHSNTDVALLNS